jgi:Tfp pilus assembly protein PilO
VSETHRIPKAAALITIIGAALLPVYPYVFTIEPARRESIRQLDQRIYKLDTQIEQARSAERKLPQFREEMHRLQSEVERVTAALPDRHDETGLRSQLAAAALMNGVTLVDLKSSPGQDPIALDHQVTLHGPLPGIVDTLAPFATSRRLYDIPRIELRRGASDWTASVRLTSFAMGN